MDKRRLSQINKYETDFVYHEIFERQLYFQNGINLKRRATVLDIGANIGLFSLYIRERYPDSHVYAFEPIPDVYRCLVKNSKRISNIRTQNVAISAKEGKARFTYYPGYTVISGIHANPRLDSKVIEAGMRSSISDKNSIEYQRVPQIVSERFQNVKTLNVPTKTISGLIGELGIKRIDLLKIDAEKSEVSILKGIRRADWAVIEQIVLEAHSKKDVGHIERLLKSKGYEVSVADDTALSSCQIRTVFAVRKKK